MTVHHHTLQQKLEAFLSHIWAKLDLSPGVLLCGCINNTHLAETEYPNGMLVLSSLKKITTRSSINSDHKKSK